MAKFFFSENYNAALERIEDHIFATTESLELTGQFLDEHDRALQFIADHPNTPAIHPITGDQTWIFDDGRYRLFFQIMKQSDETNIFLTHLIDNSEANIDVYPANKIPTYDED